MTGSIAQGADVRTPTLCIVSWRAALPGVRGNRHDFWRWVGPPELLAFKLWLFKKILLDTDVLSLKSCFLFPAFSSSVPKV